jgi:hypothetical protein
MAVARMSSGLNGGKIYSYKKKVWKGLCKINHLDTYSTAKIEDSASVG